MKYECAENSYRSSTFISRSPFCNDYAIPGFDGRFIQVIKYKKAQMSSKKLSTSIPHRRPSLNSFLVTYMYNWISIRQIRSEVDIIKLKRATSMGIQIIRRVIEQ